ncbi:MAG: SEC-C metal-binding domain-containing protein [Pseudomonadota bacterium]
MAKIGRNEKCTCGSGKKYKRCHGSIEYSKPPHSAMNLMRQRQQGLGKAIISAETSNGQRYVAVKNRLFYSKGWKTFHDFLVNYIMTTLDAEWGNTELAKPPEARHPILTWYQKLCAHQKTFITEPGKVAEAQMTGAVAAYMHLAYDLYALDHNAELQKKLVARLRNHDNFEGAWYEVFVAAIMIRAGFEVEFENEDDRSTSHCEFTATFTKTGRKFSVEAKHRAGARRRMGHLLTGALAKHAAHSRIVFIDINIPDDGSEVDGPVNMNSAIRRLRGFEGKLINGQPLPPAYLIVTNSPWQHHLDTTSFRSCIDIDGFQIPDFKANVPVSTLRAAIQAREDHIEIHELIQSIKDHSDIPSTFDGEIPEFAFNEGIPRLLIGQHYLVQDEDGTERPGKLTTATVMEAEKKAICGLTLDNGNGILCTWPLTDLEMAAWRKHPDTFFGEVGQRTTKANTPLELYDSFFKSYRDTPKERFLEFMAGAPDLTELAKLDQAKLASIYAERCVYDVLASKQLAPPEVLNPCPDC